MTVVPPVGTCAMIAARSGLAIKKHVTVGCGTVDADFRGNIEAVLFNLGQQDFYIKVGDRVTPLLLVKKCTPR